MFQSFRKVSALLLFVGVLSFSMVSVSFAASDTENSLTGFFKRLFHYPVKATQETAGMTANALQNTGEKVVAKTGENTKAVVTGDITQIDLPKGMKSGLVDAQSVLKEVRGIAFTHFTHEDVVRHPLVARIVHAYAQHKKQADDRKA